jgi:uncharacterized membrane protein YdfJ with MMPL/SSD domain
MIPAVITLMGRWNGWLPASSARLLRVEPSPARRTAASEADLSTPATAESEA